VTFIDLFSGHADVYAASRPTYPASLFAAVAAACTNHDAAWDAGTGNGQAAVALAGHFARVYATDASAQQIEHAVAHERVHYACAPERESGLPAASVDLVTAAQAAHWFDMSAFAREVRQVLRPGGVVAIWCYERCTITADVDAVVERLYTELLAPFWRPERAFVESGYRTLHFPFDEAPFPAQEMTVNWTLFEMMAYLGSWSAVQKCISAGNADPREVVAPALLDAWGAPEIRRTVTWPVMGRMGRV
jgi:SAM-dependent methyltransferase